MNHKDALSDLLLRIGKNVKEMRLKKEITQQELAFLCDCMVKSTISNIERFNYSNITIGTLVKISLVFQCDIMDLMK